MTNPAPSMEQLVDKIRHLPAERIAEVEDFVDFLQQRTAARADNAGREALDLPVISVGQWPRNVSLRRQDLYGDDGR